MSEQVNTEPEEQHHHHHHHHHHSLLVDNLQEKASKVFHAMAKLPFAVCVGLVFLMPLAYFGGERWWIPAVWMFLILAYMMWGLSVWWCGKDYAHVKFSGWGLLFFVPMLVGLIQLMPMKGLTKILSPKAYEQWEAVAELGQDINKPELEPEEIDESATGSQETLTDIAKLDLKLDQVKTRVSVSPCDTREMVGLFGACLLLFILLTSKLHHTYQIRVVLLAIVATALGNAIFAFVESFGAAAGENSTFNGVFANRNHFAFMMMMGVMSTVGLMGVLTGSKRHGAKLEGWWPKLLVPLSIILFVLLTAMVMSLSRGAFLATIISLVVFGGVWLFSLRGQSMAMRQKTFALLAVVAVAFLIGMPYVMERLSERYEELMEEDLTMDARYEVWKDTCHLIGDYWRFGTGLGGYESSIQPYEQERFTEARIGHAHNDLLELTSEIGVPAVLLMVVVALLMWVRSMHIILRHQERTYRWSGLGAGVALLGITLHECVEFNLLAWSNMLVFTALLSVVAVCGSDRHRRLKTKKTEEEKAAEKANGREKRRQNRHERWRWRLALVPLSLALLFGLPPCLKRMYAGWVYADFLNDLHLPAVEGRPVKYDCERRLRKLKKVMLCWPNDHYVLWRSSSVKALAAAEYDENLWRVACEESARSLMQAPGDGDAALQCALYWENAKAQEQIMRSRRQIVKLYDWAVRRQPTISDTLYQAGMGAYRAYQMAESFEDPKTREYKDMASRNLTNCLSYGNTSYDTIFEMLADLVGGEKQLARIIPSNLKAQQAMVSLLMRRRLFDDALDLTERLLKQALEPKDKLDLLQTKCTILEMADRHEERAQVWKDLVAQEISELPMEEAMALFADGEARKALNLLFRKRGTIVLDPKEILLEAQILSLLGKYEEIAQTLMRLAYIEGPIDRGMLDNAVKLLGGEETVWKDYMVVRVKFLEMALMVKYGAQSLVGNTVLASRLELLEKDAEKARPQWLQRHLIPYYAGLVWEANGKNEEAAKAYRRCLDICPNHLWSMKHLSVIDSTALTADEQSLLALATKRLSPIATVAPGLQWIALSASPEELTELYTVQDFEYIFLCVADVNSNLRLNINFGDKKGYAYSDRIEPKDGLGYTLRVGELMRVVRKGWQPQTLTLTSRRRIMDNGDVVARYGKFSTKAFKVNVKGAVTPKSSGKGTE